MNLMYAQIPSGYYDNASGLDDDALKSALNKVIMHFPDQVLNSLGYA